MARRADSSFLGFLCLVYGIAFVGYLGMRQGLAVWYGSLLHPPQAPAPWVLGPVWMVLYLSLGYSGWLIFSAERGRLQRVALVLFFGVICLGSAWTWLFFGFHTMIPSLVGACVLWAVTASAAIVSIRVKPAIAVFLVPYLIWVTFMGYLAFGMWSLNFRMHQGVTPIETSSNPGGFE